MLLSASRRRLMHSEIQSELDAIRAEAVERSGRADVLFVGERGAAGYARVVETIRQGHNVLTTFGATRSAADVASIESLAEEAGVAVAFSALLRSLELTRSLREERPRIVSLVVGCSAGNPIVDLAGILDAGRSLAGDRDAQRVDAEALVPTGHTTATVGASVRFQNGSLLQLLLHEGRDELSFTIAGENGVRSARLDTSALVDELKRAAQYEADAFVADVLAARESGLSAASAAQTLRLAENIMRRLRRRAVVTV